MDTTSPVYDQLNKAWKATCRILFGEEIGELKEYEEWLKEYMPVIGKRKSYISGKDVTVAFDDYCEDARFVSLDEVKEKSIKPLTINEIKDIDSIIEAISEKWEYTGNKILGNSNFVEASDSVLDSQYISNSTSINNSQYVYASSIITANSRYIFGCIRTDMSEFVIRCVRGSELKRQFETRFTVNCRDSYVCSGCHNCQEILFSFNLRNKNRCIGNLQLPLDKYKALKTKLIDEIKEEIKSNKRFPSIFELVPNKLSESMDISVEEKKTEFNKAAIEKAFQSTFKILFKCDPIGSIEDYGSWLSRHVGLVKEVDTPLGHKATVLSDKYYPIYSKIPTKRVISAQEALRFGEIHLDENEITSLEKIKKNLQRIGYFVDEMLPQGMCKNVMRTQGIIDSMNIYNCGGSWRSENSAFTDQSILSKYVFGGIHTNSQFCINCYESMELNRCFEVDSSKKCSDTYFAHNCEGLSEAMFCWNAKGKRYAIGNAQLQPEQYRKIKDKLIEQIADELISKKELRLDIYNIGCGKK